MTIGGKDYDIIGFSVSRSCRTGEAEMTLAVRSEDGAAGKVKLGYEDWKYFAELATHEKMATPIELETRIPDWWRWVDEIGMVAGYSPRYRMEQRGWYPEDAEPHPGPRFNCAGEVVMPKED